MKLENIDVEFTLSETKRLLEEDPNLSPALKHSVSLLLLLVTLLLNRLGLNSSNSSKPPSSDPNRIRKKQKSSTKDRGGQKGHNGTNLKPVSNPDVIETIPVDQSLLPVGDYKEVGYESRQVIDIKISQIVTEYRAQIIESSTGKRYTASFPEHVTRPVQYGVNLKSLSVYLSQHQLVPYSRIEEIFVDQAGVSLSSGSIYNFNEEAYKRLETFDKIVKSELKNSDLCHVDETGINIDGKRNWLHCVSNTNWTYFFPHMKRGMQAIEAMEILPSFNGILCHDHWKPYFKLECRHSLCNAHHLRELERSLEQYDQKWAKDVKSFLLEVNKGVAREGGQLTLERSSELRFRYRSILKKAEQECPAPSAEERKNKRGRIKRSPPRNLLERLIEYENEVLRFMEDKIVPFTNNQAENDIRMTKVQQKISGCFRSNIGAKIFCRVRSYISTCRKNGVSASLALKLLFKGKLPLFLCNNLE